MTPMERKGLLVSKGITMREVAERAGCSTMRVSEVVRGLDTFVTPITRKVRATVAEMTDTPYEVIWPEHSGMAA